MFKDIKALLDKAQTAGDVATIVLAGTAGFVADAGLNFVGFLSPGYVGFAAASTAFGLKKSVEAAGKDHALQKARKHARDEQMQRARNLLHLFQQDTRVDLASEAARELSLLDAGGADPDSSRAALDALVNRYRKP